jgi:hypothetical protein
MECKKAICGKCVAIIKGKNYCKPCVELMFRDKEPLRPVPASAVVAPPHAHATHKPAAVTAASVEDEGNTSGQGKGAAVPPEVRGWNWGAFLLNWIWGMGNGVWIALLTFILGPIMSIILGIKGNEWAWRNKKWDSVEKFKKTQRAWTWSGVGLTCVSILLAVVVLITAGSQDTLSEATMCKNINPQTHQPLDKTDTFSPDTAVINLTVKLSNAPPDTEVNTQWTYVKGEGVTNYQMGEYSVKTDGTRYISFSLDAPDKGFPRGDYAVTLQVNGKTKMTVPFSVKGGGGSAPAQTSGVPLANTFQEAGFGYTIKYPSDWAYEKPEKGDVIISGKQGTEAYEAIVRIQNVLSSKSGGTVANVDAVLDSFKNSIKSADANAKFYGEKAFVYTMPDGTKLNGKEITMEYTSKGQVFKTRRIAIPMSSGNIFLVWLYQARLAIYDTYLPIAQGMLDSWNFTQ